MQIDLNEEVRCGYAISTEMKRVWAVELDLAMKLKAVCDKYHLHFFMQAGTLLGAVRHQGFIPWDDDMDFVMPREDFNILVSVAEKEFVEPYFLQTLFNSDEIFNNGRAVLRNSNTTGVQNRKDLYKKGNHGIGIDINILDNVSDCKKKRAKYWEKADKLLKLITLKYYGVKIKKAGSLKITFYDKIRYYIFFLADKQLLCRKLNSVFKSHKDNNSLFLNIMTQFSYRHNLYYRSDYEGCVYLKFETIELPAPKGFERILKTDFGSDYMKLPEKENRNSRHYPVIKPEIPYRNYMKHYHNIFENVEQRKIIIFGAGQMLFHYLDHTDEKFHPVFIVDNNKALWGTKLSGIEVRNPYSILDVSEYQRHVIICSIYYKEIECQLMSMGIRDYYFYVQNVKWI